MQFAPERFAHYRKRAGLSREQVAVAIGRSYQLIVLYERGESTPPRGVQIQLAALLGQPLVALCEDELVSGGAS